MLTLVPLVFIFISCRITNLVCASFYDNVPDAVDGILGIPLYYDGWCASSCSSLNSCNELFGADHLDLELKLAHSILDGPGAHLENGRFHGDSIRRQTYETQFVLDVATALEISPCAIYILSIEPGRIGHYRDFDHIFLRFRLFDVSLDLIKDLTRQVQVSDSHLYRGKVTNSCDLMHGLVIREWDFSLKMMYSIEIIGGLDVEDINGTLVLRQGGYRQCIMSNQSSVSSYCEFEELFRMDMSRILQMDIENIEVLFIKSASEDGILIYFRIYPPQRIGITYDNAWTKKKGEQLSLWFQNKQIQFILNGNVTFRVDSTYGISGEHSIERTDSSHLRVLEEPMFFNDYERCKSTQRCPRAIASYNVSSMETAFYFQFHSNGKMFDVPIFCDFEDWRVGSHGWSFAFPGDDRKPRGAHWSPFQFDPLGPTMTQQRNRIFDGLVLDSYSLTARIQTQNNVIEELDQKVKWIGEVSPITSLGATFKSRQNILNAMFTKRLNFLAQKESEEKILIELSSSQCVQVPCNLQFNSSNLLLTGAVSGKGAIAKTKNGTEVAVWTFSSINLDSNVHVSFTGQRAIALLSRSSVYMDTKFVVIPGTLGGMPGGYSVSRGVHNQLRSICSEDVMGLNWRSNCEGDEAKLMINNSSVSNNVNGIGSPSLRTYEFRIDIVAETVHAVHSIRSNANKGQRITGGFVLHFRNYSTPFIIHNVDPYELKRIMEDSLNPSKVNNLRNINRENVIPGIGIVSVSRNIFESSGGFEWKITYESAIGNMDGHKLTSTNLLVGVNATIDILTVTNGNAIGGTFSINFLGKETRPFMHNISDLDMELALMQDIPDIVNVSVLRSQSSQMCLDGFCQNGPSQSGGHTWKLRIATMKGNISPTSPTSPEHQLEGIISELKVTNNLTGCVQHKCPEIHIARSTDRPYSLSYGGGGAGYGSSGGYGFSHVPPGSPYGDDGISDLLGGSGGALGVSLPNDVQLMGMASRVRGGSGGGAIEIVAINDIVLGSNSIISCDAENGWSGFRSGGGGGSGGSILIAAGGAVVVDGILSVEGGNGGVPRSTESGYKQFSGGGGSGGRIAVYAESLKLGGNSSLNFSGGGCNLESKSNCEGMVGTMKKYLSNYFVTYKIDTEKGAQGTKSSLALFGGMLETNIEMSLPAGSEVFGPIFRMKENNRPERISFYLQFATDFMMSPTLGWRYSILLLESVEDKDVKALGMSFSSTIEHGEIVASISKAMLKRQKMINTRTTVAFDKWVKVDVKFDWDLKVYSLYLEDMIISTNAHLGLSHVSALGISKTASNVDAWLDEVYVGIDGEYGFRCPRLNQNGITDVPFGENRNRDWTENEKGARETIFEQMTHHDSHLSERKIYKTKDGGGMKYFDGSGHINFSSDVKHQWKTIGNNILQPGTMLKIKDGSSTEGYVWYGEYHSSNDHSLGGIGSCSTTDMRHWKNNGIMLHNANITDMVRGYSGPLHIERPKILFNSETKKYVMWFIVDNENRSLAMAGVATSDHSQGPFVFVRSFYPDGNKTRDFNLFQDEDGTSYLIRTFFDTIEYVIPSPVMDPIWESVKNSDGSTNFGLTYHRAFYHSGYDDYDDIQAQRWSGEDEAWKVLCIDRMMETEREIPYGARGDELCSGPYEMKVVIGQGDPKAGPIRSRYLDPFDPKNNVWKPSSVPGLKAQSWQANYEDSICGIRENRQDTQTFHPMLNEPIEAPNGKYCPSIVDNPIHATNRDTLEGRPRVVEKRTAKFIAVSRLTDDYLDTTGALSVYEGELEEGADLSFIVSQAKQKFGWNHKNGQVSQSTFTSLVTDSGFQNEVEANLRRNQYQKDYNDQAEYSFHSLRI